MRKNFWWWSFSPHFSPLIMEMQFTQLSARYSLASHLYLSRVSYTNKLFLPVILPFTEFIQHQHRRTYALLSPKMCSAVSVTVNTCVKVFQASTLFINLSNLPQTTPSLNLLLFGWSCYFLRSETQALVFFLIMLEHLCVCVCVWCIRWLPNACQNV